MTAIGENGEVFAPEYFCIFDQPNRTRYRWLHSFFYIGNCLCHPSVLFRRSAFEKSGGYRYGLIQTDDFDLWVRLCLKNDIHVLPKKLTRFRIRENASNMSADTPTTRIRWRFEVLQILENYRNIDDIDEFLAIFPKAREYHSEKGFNIEFLLAMVAIHDGPWIFTKLFGQSLLFQLLNKSQSARDIKSIYGFDCVQFKQITGVHDIFSIERLGELEARRTQPSAADQMKS